MNLLLFFVVGLFLGSFTLVVINRSLTGKSFLKGRSVCDFCDHTLAWYDLFPVLSYILLRGMCRYCHKKLSMSYPLSEVGTGLFFLFSLAVLLPRFDPLNMFEWFILGFYSFILITLIVTVVIDYKVGLIPFFMVIPAIIFITGVIATTPLLSAPYAFFSGIGAFLFFFLIILITRGKGMGFGDAVFAIFMGLLLGFPEIITALYIAFLTGAVVSLILILWKKKKLKNSTIPFGPFLVFGTYITLLYGPYITDFFLRVLLH